tara:strand:- start:229 stop:504 length:276 start_codon:yes stop_codon:yes gene_type:complete
MVTFHLTYSIGPVSIYIMVVGSLALIRIRDHETLAVYRGRYSEFYKHKSAKDGKYFTGEDPLVFTEDMGGGKFKTRLYFLKEKDFYLEWLT